jgi:hypothetical protein
MGTAIAPQATFQHSYGSEQRCLRRTKTQTGARWEVTVVDGKPSSYTKPELRRERCAILRASKRPSFFRGSSRASANSGVSYGLPQTTRPVHTRAAFI